MRFIACCTFVLLTAVTINAAIIRVPIDQLTIQAGIGAAADFDTVLVAPGEYSESIKIYAKSGISLFSSDGRAATSIVSPTAAPCISLTYPQDSMIYIRGFTIKNPSGSGGILCTGGAVVIEECDLVDITGSGIAALAPVTIRRCLISNCQQVGIQASWGKGLLNVSNCVISNNGEGAIEFWYRRAKIHHNLVVHNSISGIHGDSGIVYNNTVVSNGGGIYLRNDTVINNIVAFNSRYGVSVPSGLYADFNDEFHNENVRLQPSHNNIIDDPLFRDTAHGDYSLMENSPCINSGHVDDRFNDSDGTQNDMGAFPTHSVFPVPTSIAVSPDRGPMAAATRYPQFHWGYQDAVAATQSAFQIQFGVDNDWSDAELWDSGPVSSSTGYVVYAGAPLTDHNSYFLRLRVSDGTRWGQWIVRSFRIDASSVFLVPQQVPTIQAAINMASLGDTVLVAPGVYSEQLNLPETPVVLKSTGGRESTILKGTGASDYILKCNTQGITETVIDGFTIDGNGTSYGVQVYNSAPLIQNCEFRNCRVHALACLISGARVKDCTFHHNNGTAGSAVYFEGASPSSLEFHHNILYNNSGGSTILCGATDNIFIHHNLIRHNTESSSSSGAIRLDNSGGNIRVTNNTLVSNVNGIVASNSSAYVLNNIVSSNKSGGISPIAGQVDYNDVWDCTTNINPGPHGLSVDPDFYSSEDLNYTLRSNSPCINTGDPSPLYNDPDGSRADMGALASIHFRPSVDSIFVNATSRLRVADHTPVFHWKYMEPLFVQQAFRVEVAPDSRLLLDDVIWRSGVIADPTDSIVYTGNTLLDGETYVMRIAISDGSSWGSFEPFVFRMNRAPGAPAPLSPLAAGETGFRTTRIDAVVHADPDGDSLFYYMELYRDAGLTDLVFEQQIVTSVEDTVSSEVIAGLTPSTPYWWRCRVFDGAEYSPWSETIAFKTRSVHSIHVPEDLSSIRDAIDLALDGDTVYVAPGTYGGPISLWGKPIVVLAEDTTAVTLITGRRPILFESGEDTLTVIQGITFEGKVDCVRSSPTIQNCDFRNIEAGPAIMCYFSSAKIRNNRFFNCKIFDQGIISISGAISDTPEIGGNEIFSNASMTYGTNVYALRGINCQASTSAYIHHNLIYDNYSTKTGSCGINIYGTGSGVRIENNTIVDNSCGMLVAGTASPSVRNNVIAFNPGGGIPVTLTSADYNCVYANDSVNNPGLNGIIADPKFICPEMHDYHLVTGSPCIDAGDPDPVHNDADGSRNDIGAHSFQYVRPWTINVHAEGSPAIPVINRSPIIYWSTRTVSSVQTAFELEIGLDSNWAVAEMWKSGTIHSSDTSIIYAGPTLQDRVVYHMRVRSRDVTAWGDWSSTATFVTRYKSNIHVPADYPTIQAAIDAAIDRDTVWVAPGTYSETIDFRGRHITLKSERGPQSTVITKSESDDLVVIGPGGDSLTVLDGFTLVGGRMAIWCKNAGPKIVHNILRGQHIGNWAALSLGGTTIGSTGNSPAHIINNTIVGSANGGLCIYSSTPPVVKNNILAGNRQYGIAVGNVPSVTVRFNNSWGSFLNLQGNVIAGEGSMSVDPLLDSSLLMLSSSPCINAGDPDSTYTDRDGTRNDMGAISYSCCDDPSRGDINNDGQIDVSDLSLLVMRLTGLAPSFACPVAADVSGSNRIDLADLSAFVGYFTGSGNQLPSCASDQDWLLK